jgi:hypothetical protein
MTFGTQTYCLFLRDQKWRLPIFDPEHLATPKVYKYHYFQLLLIYNIIALGLALGKQMRQLAVRDIFATACIALHFTKS